MIWYFFRSFNALLEQSSAYPDLRIDQRVHGWMASGRTSYTECGSGNFAINYSDYFEEWRGACLLTEISVVLYQANQSVRARPYVSAGTGFSHFEIVEEEPNNFCIRRVGTEC